MRFARPVDVLILGGGPAGSAAGMALAARGVSTVIVERSAYEEPRLGETFPPAIQPVLQQLGAWDDFLVGGHLPSAGVRSVWGSAEPFDRSFLFDPYGTGWHVDRRAFDAALARMAERHGARLLLRSRVSECSRDGQGWWTVVVIGPDGACRLRGRFLVDATGRGSGLARRLGSSRIQHDRLLGAYGCFTRPPGEPFALIEAVETGWWYSAPLPGDRQVAGFMTDADLCQRTMLCDLDTWQRALDAAPYTRHRVAGSDLRSSIRVVSARSLRLDPPCGEGWLAVGDAASSTDPLAGDGVHRALASGLRAAEVILRCLESAVAQPANWSADTDREFVAYLRSRAGYYSRERRWPGSPFWTRRTATDP